MSKYNYKGSEQFRPLSAWAYVGYTLLFAIPLIGTILLFVFSFSDNNINRRSFARSYFCWLLIALIIFLIATASSGAFSSYSGYINYYLSHLHNSVQSIMNRIPFLPRNNTGTEFGQFEAEQSDGTTSSLNDSMVEVQVGDKTLSIHKSFKDAMDRYEEFIDEYVEVVKTQDTLRLSSYITKYAETIEALEEMKDEDLSNEELLYYTEVHTRIVQKLTAIA